MNGQEATHLARAGRRECLWWTGRTGVLQDQEVVCLFESLGKDPSGGRGKTFGPGRQKICQEIKINEGFGSGRKRQMKRCKGA